MKSLEYIENEIKLLGRIIVESYENKPLINIFDISNLEYRLKLLRQVRRELEVLEIIKKVGCTGYPTFLGNTISINNLTFEQYRKIMKCLEDK